MDILNSVYLVNLDNRKDRLVFMDYKLQELGISYTRIPAILGSDHSDEYYNYMKQFTQDELLTKPPIINSLGAYGLLLTYKENIAPLYKINKHITVLEDDCFFHKNFNNLLEEYKPIIKKYDVIWLGCQQVKWWDYMDDQSEKYGYYNTNTKSYPYTGFPYGTYGIV